MQRFPSCRAGFVGKREWRAVQLGLGGEAKAESASSPAFLMENSPLPVPPGQEGIFHSAVVFNQQASMEADSLPGGGGLFSQGPRKAGVMFW